MWISGDVDEIERAVARGDLEETASFDGKRELPPSTTKGNASVAIDVAAMSTDGGTILYGVGEDADKRLTERRPIELAGAADRIAQIVQTSIAEIPYIEFRPYPLADEPSKGFLLVIVPPSARAPHQVSVGDDRRFYGRGARGNRRLSEQEVALLYSRRQRGEVNLSARLEEVVQTTPYVPEGPDDGSVYAFAQPAQINEEMWDAAAVGAGGLAPLQQRLSSAAREVSTEPDFDPSFSRMAFWHRVGADAWRVSSQPEDPPRPDFIAFLSDITFSMDGRAVLFASSAVRRVTDRTGQRDSDGAKYIFERNIAGNLAAFIGATAVLFEQAGYFGAVDLGVAVTNLHGAMSVGRYEHVRSPMVIRSHEPAYNSSTYTRTCRLSAARELAKPENVALALLGRLFIATTGRDYDPFQRA